MVQTFTTEHGETTIQKPLRIRLWYWAHDQTERLYHWIWRAKISPWHAATRPVDTIEASAEEKSRGITHKKIYVSHG